MHTPHTIGDTWCKFIPVTGIEKIINNWNFLYSEFLNIKQ